MNIADAMVVLPDLAVWKQWVVWSYESRGPESKPAKVPYCPSCPSLRASVDNPSTWAYPELALSASYGGRVDGIGFVLTHDDPYMVIDLDNCRDPHTGHIEQWARAIVERINTFTEISPSGTGLHLWCWGKLACGGRRSGPIEVYADRRFIAWTGELLPGLPATIEDRQETLDQWVAETFSAPVQRRQMEKTRVGGGTITKPASRFPQCTDEDVLRKAEQASNGAHFRSLFHDGDLTAYDGDHSRADQALCGHLAYWTNGDGEQMDRLFRRSALMRPKWDELRGELSYGEKTIQTAIEGRIA